MTLALMLGLLAGIAAAAGIVEAAAALASARARRGRLMVAALNGLVRVGRRLGAPAPPADLETRIVAAGAPLGAGMADVMAAKAAGALVAAIGGGPLCLALPGRLPAVALLALPVIGYLLPDAWLRAHTRARARAMQAELPGMLDLLRAAVAAGMAPLDAMGEVGARGRGALAREWARAAAEVELGASRHEALTRLARRCPLPAVGTLVATLERAAHHGAPLVETLGGQARDERATRARLVQEHAARAAPKIQLVVALLLVPSVLLLVAAALLAGLAR